MKQDHFLLVTLSVIVLINIIAIILLQNDITVDEPVLYSAYSQPEVRTLILSDKKCIDCYDIRRYVAALNSTVNMQVEDAPADLFDTPRLPAIAFNATLEKYPSILRGWDQVGFTTEIQEGKYKGTWYVLPTLNAPYVSEDKVHGRVTVIYITLDSCKECYDVFVNREYMNSSRIEPYKEIIVDAESTEGKVIIERYNITAVPTIIMDKEASEYPNLQPGWNVVGTIEQDGSYVLRELHRLDVTYYDLAHKKLMKA